MTKTPKRYCDKCRRVGRRPAVERNPGLTFGKLTTVAFEQRQGKSQKYWFALCRCECGNQKWINWYNLLGGGSKSCGCDQTKKMRERRTAEGRERHASIVEMAKKHPEFTYEQIALEHGITREWVRQILKEELGEQGVATRKTNRRSMDRNAYEELERLRLIVYGKTAHI